MHQMKFKFTIKKVTLSFLVVLAFSGYGFASESVEQESLKPKPAAPLVTSQVKQEVVIEEPQSLFAENTPIKREIEIIDSLMLLQELAEEEMLYPSEDLYESWNNTNVNPYRNLTAPESYAIDLSSTIMPIDDEVIRVTSRFGFRGRRMHNGIDLKVQIGDTIRAVSDGKVRVRQYERKGYGYFLVLRHSNGLETVYGHLSEFLVEQDDIVYTGQAIALGGNTGRSTGSHLHFETRFFGVAIDPADMFDFHNKVMHVDTYVYNKKAMAAKKYTGNGASKMTYHRVKKGDTLGSIARRHGITISQLCKLNKITTKTTLRVGRTLRCS